MAKVRTLYDCIGDWFEGVVQRDHPTFKKVGDERGTQPDFDCGTFLAEAKVGFLDYGSQLKEAQIHRFKSNGRPIVYMVGYHTLPGLKESTRGMYEDEIDKLLRRQAGVHSVYVVSNSIMQRIWMREYHVAAQNPEWKYLSVKPRHFNAIIDNRPFWRSGVRHMPSRRYRICRPKLLLQPAPSLAGKKSKLQLGFILDRTTDEAVIDYFNDRHLIK